LAGKESFTSTDLFNKFDLQTDTDLFDKRTQKVALLTMHAAKGLEFPVVFISGCETDLIPLKPKDGHLNDLAEERRLFYVAMTRAKEKLYLTYALKRRIFGRYQQRRPSVFIDYIDRRLKSIETPSYRSASGQSQRGAGQVQLKLF
jgi:DNA helicase-2/ATP-dependent DNA helicase PcrA